MRILCLVKNDENRCASTSWYLRRELAKIEDVVFYGPGYGNFPILKGWDVPTAIKRVLVDRSPDVILIDHYWEVAHRWKNLHRVSVPKALIISDPHEEPSRKVDYIKQNNIDLALFITRFSIDKFKDIGLSAIGCSCAWLPWSVDTSVFKDYGLSRIHDVSFLGMVNRYYPLRQKILKVLPKTKDIRFYTRKHPGDWNLKPERDLFRESYARILAQSKIFIFDSSILNYPVAKYVEGMACKTLVMAPMPLDGEYLHFKPGFNFVEVNEDNFLENIRYYLSHEDERLRIAERGWETVNKYHTVQIRARQLVRYLRGIAT